LRERSLELARRRAGERKRARRVGEFRKQVEKPAPGMCAFA
jgi:hypothetical protein